MNQSKLVNPQVALSQLPENDSFNVISSFPIRIWKWSGLPWWLCWALFWIGIIVTDFMLNPAGLVLDPGRHVMIGFISFFYATVFGTAYCSNLLRDFYPVLPFFISWPANDLKNWYKEKYRRAYSVNYIPALALIFASFSTFALQHPVLSISSFEPLFWFRMAYLWVGLFWIGIGLFAVVMVIKMSLELSEFPVKVTIHNHPDSSVLSLGRLFLKMGLSVTAAYCCVVITAVIAFNRFGNIFAGEHFSWILIGLLVLGALTTFGFFIIPQFGFHKCMVREKEIRISAFSGFLDKSLEEATSNPTMDNIQKLKDLIELQQHLSNMNEWPFDSQALWSLISALILPMLLAVFEIMIS